MCSLPRGEERSDGGRRAPDGPGVGAERSERRGPREAGVPSPRRQTLASGVKRERNGARSYKEGHTRPPGREGEEPEGRKERSDCQGLDSLVLPIHPWMEGKFP